MFKRFSWVLLVTILLSVAIFSTAKADEISGNFKFDISLKPQTTAAEASKFDIDFEALLDLYIPLDNLEVGAHTALGVAGLEHAVFDLEAIFPAWTIKDEFAFAVPFQTTTGGAVTVIPPGDLLFVKKRVEITLTYAGITLKNLAIFEDATFPNPGAAYTGTDYGPSDQNFHFGDIIALSGQTTDGVRVEAVTGLCAAPDSSNSIKKKSWSGSVCENGEFEFTVEKITISNLSVGGISFRSVTKFKPARPVSETLTLKFSLADLADVTAVFTTDDITSFSLSSGSLKMEVDNITLTTSIGSDLSITSNSVTVKLVIDTLTLTATATLTPDTGMTSLSLSARFALTDDSSFSISSSFSGGPPASWSSTTFTLGSVVGGIDVSLDSTFAPSGLSKAGVKMESVF